MRVTQSMMYKSFISNMQSTLGAYMESNMQGASQKKINRPSDDPAGMALVLNSRRSIDETTQLQRNVDTAQGWLNLADSTLTQVSTTITSIKALAEQAATGTMTPENRLQVSTQLRQLFGQLLNLSNMQFEGNSIFAGHKYNQPAFEEALAVNTMDPALENINYTVTGKLERSMMVRFTNTGSEVVGGPNPISYSWSNDGGNTWNNATLNAGENTIAQKGMQLTIPMGSTIPAQNPAAEPNAKDGILYIRPTAVYQGDEQGAQPYAKVTNGSTGINTIVNGSIANNVRIDFTSTADLRTDGGTLSYDMTYNGVTTSHAVNLPNPATGSLSLGLPGGGTIEFNATQGFSMLDTGTSIDVQPRRVDMMGGPVGLQVNAQGTYNRNMLVRVDDNVALNVADQTVHYSYSTDNGNTWVRAQSQTPGTMPNPTRLPVPGGYLELTPSALGPNLNAGTQFVIHPDRADLNYEIMQNTYVSVNSVGKDVFGGMFNGKPALPGDQNLFEVVGKLIAYTENNNQQGVQQCLAALTTAQEKVLTEAARIGGLENRLSLAKDMLSFEKLDQEERLSYTEDVDLTVLLTRMAQQELAYNTVLKSSSMIMQLNLTKFV